MNNLLKEKLDEEQSIVINSKDKYIVVSACPGSGKTYTLIQRLKKELESIYDYQGIIACSFTNEASDEIKNRLGNSFDLSNSFIGTIDSFLKYIISMFVNRILFSKEYYKKQIVISNKIYLPSDIFTIKGRRFPNPNKINNPPYTMNEIVSNYVKSESVRKLANRYCKEEWLEKLLNSELEISFPMYLFGIKIVKLDIFKDWFNNHFTTIYIDEAQDLNYFQHCFFDCLKKETNISIVMLGDPNQSIYQFRGAKPTMFKSMKEKGYTEYSLTYSCRCNPNIMEIANRIYKPSKGRIDDISVFKIKSINLEFLKSLKSGTYILTDDNKTASQLYNKYKCEEYDIIFSKKIDFKNECNDYFENSLIIDELIKYYYNYDNKEDKYKYPFNKIEPIIKEANHKYKSSIYNLSNYKTIVDFLNQAKIDLQINVSDKTIEKIGSKLDISEYKYYYYLSTSANKIMTIHTSKGLESNNVIIFLTNAYDKPSSEEFKNKLFVAITRAKEKVYIIANTNMHVSDYIDNLLE